MPGLYRERSLSNVATASFTAREHFKSLTNFSGYSTSPHLATPKLQLPARVPSSTDAKTSERIKIEKILSKDATTTRMVDLVTYPLQDKSCIGSSGSESDLAAMVHDFLEYGSYGCEMHDGSESDGVLPSPSKLYEDLQVLMALAPIEKRLLALLKKIVRSIDEHRDLVCLDDGSECRGSCVRQIVVKHFRYLGYNAAICKAKWPNSEIVVGGEHEYIDLVLDGVDVIKKDRLIVDLDFRSQFEIARPTQHYVAVLNMLPTMFVGSSEKLYQILQIMSDAASCSLKQNSLYLPPWRTLDYICAKWFSPCERIFDNVKSGILQGHASFSKCSGTKRCFELLRLMKASLVVDSERNLNLASSLNKRQGVSFLRIKARN